MLRRMNTILMWVGAGVPVVFIWCLPLLGRCGFASDHGHTVSEFISTPQATGALASTLFVPLWTIFEQDLPESRAWKLSQNAVAFFLCLTLTLSIEFNSTAHTISFALLGTSLFFYAFRVWVWLRCPTAAGVALVLAAASASVLIGLHAVYGMQAGLILWAFECIAFSSILFFSPLCSTACM